MVLARRTAMLLITGVLCFLLYQPLGKADMLLAQQVVNTLALLLW